MCALAAVARSPRNSVSKKIRKQKLQCLLVRGPPLLLSEAFGVIHSSRFGIDWVWSFVGLREGFGGATTSGDCFSRDRRLLCAITVRQILDVVDLVVLDRDSPFSGLQHKNMSFVLLYSSGPTDGTKIY